MIERPQVILHSNSRPKPKGDFNFSFDSSRTKGLSNALQQHRQRSWEIFKGLTIPDSKQDAWRRTDLRSLDPLRFQLDDQPLIGSLPKELREPMIHGRHGGQLILSGSSSQLDMEVNLVKKGIIFTDIRTAEKKYPDLLAQVLGRTVKPDDGKFAAMANAFVQNGVFLYVPKNTQVDLPLHSIHWGAAPGTAQFSQIVVWMEAGSTATYIHEVASPGNEGQSALHAGTVELILEAGSNLKFVELQSWGEDVWHFSHERAIVNESAVLEWIFGAVGSHLTKNFTEIDLIGKGATGKMSGFYFTDKTQHLDHDTQQNHLAPDTTSDLLFKGALTDSSRSVWQGMIYVAPGAIKSDGYQANRNLLLSRKARADSIPGLEILADDVRCTHGATVGRIDEEQVFYLMSRGISEHEAKRLIVEGFFEPIMNRIPFEGVQRRFRQAIHDKMAGFSG